MGLKWIAPAQHVTQHQGKQPSPAHWAKASGHRVGLQHCSRLLKCAVHRAQACTLEK